MTSLTTVGYGDFTGNTKNELIFQIFVLMIGICAYSWFISSMSNYIHEINKPIELYNEKIKILDSIKLKHPQMDEDLYYKISKHIKNISFKEDKDQRSFIDSLPYTLKYILLSEMFKPMINNFKLFKNFKNTDFALQIIPKLVPIIAEKDDLLIDQGDIIENMIIVKEGRLTLEIKINIDNPISSINKLLNDEIFGLQNINELKNTTTLFRTLTDENKNKKISENNCDLNLMKHENISGFLHLKILDILKNEHFGGLMMFLNKKTSLTLRVKSTKADLYFFKKIDAIEISSKYPNIWQRVNKRSFHNLQQISKYMIKILKQFCETYGVQNYRSKFKIIDKKNTIRSKTFQSSIVKKQKEQSYTQSKSINSDNFSNIKFSSLEPNNSIFSSFSSIKKMKTEKVLRKSNIENENENIINQINDTIKNNLNNNSYDLGQRPQLCEKTGIQKDGKKGLTQKKIPTFKNKNFLRFNDQELSISTQSINIINTSKKQEEIKKNLTIEASNSFRINSEYQNINQLSNLNYIKNKFFQNNIESIVKSNLINSSKTKKKSTETTFKNLNVISNTNNKTFGSIIIESGLSLPKLKVSRKNNFDKTDKNKKKIRIKSSGDVVKFYKYLDNKTIGEITPNKSEARRKISKLKSENELETINVSPKKKKSAKVNKNYIQKHKNNNINKNNMLNVASKNMQDNSNVIHDPDIFCFSLFNNIFKKKNNDFINDPNEE